MADFWDILNKLNLYKRSVGPEGYDESIFKNLLKPPDPVAEFAEETSQAIREHGTGDIDRMSPERAYAESLMRDVGSTGTEVLANFASPVGALFGTSSVGRGLIQHAAKKYGIQSLGPSLLKDLSRAKAAEAIGGAGFAGQAGHSLVEKYPEFADVSDGRSWEEALGDISPEIVQMGLGGLPAMGYAGRGPRINLPGFGRSQRVPGTGTSTAIQRTEQPYQVGSQAIMRRSDFDPQAPQAPIPPEVDAKIEIPPDLTPPPNARQARFKENLPDWTPEGERSVVANVPELRSENVTTWDAPEYPGHAWVKDNTRGHVFLVLKSELTDPAINVEVLNPTQPEIPRSEVPQITVPDPITSSDPRTRTATATKTETRGASMFDENPLEVKTPDELATREPLGPINSAIRERLKSAGLENDSVDNLINGLLNAQSPEEIHIYVVGLQKQGITRKEIDDMVKEGLPLGEEEPWPQPDPGDPDALQDQPPQRYIDNYTEGDEEEIPDAIESWSKLSPPQKARIRQADRIQDPDAYQKELEDTVWDEVLIDPEEARSAREDYRKFIGQEAPGPDEGDIYQPSEAEREAQERWDTQRESFGYNRDDPDWTPEQEEEYKSTFRYKTPLPSEKTVGDLDLDEGWKSIDQLVSDSFNKLRTPEETNNPPQVEITNMPPGNFEDLIREFEWLNHLQENTPEQRRRMDEIKRIADNIDYGILESNPRANDLVRRLRGEFVKGDLKDVEPVGRVLRGEDEITSDEDLKADAAKQLTDINRRFTTSPRETGELLMSSSKPPRVEITEMPSQDLDELRREYQGLEYLVKSGRGTPEHQRRMREIEDLTGNIDSAVLGSDIGAKSTYDLLGKGGLTPKVRLKMDSVGRVLEGKEELRYPGQIKDELNEELGDKFDTFATSPRKTGEPLMSREPPDAKIEIPSEEIPEVQLESKGPSKSFKKGDTVAFTLNGKREIGEITGFPNTQDASVKIPNSGGFIIPISDLSPTKSATPTSLKWKMGDTITSVSAGGKLKGKVIMINSSGDARIQMANGSEKWVAPNTVTHVEPKKDKSLTQTLTDFIMGESEELPDFGSKPSSIPGKTMNDLGYSPEGVREGRLQIDESVKLQGEAAKLWGGDPNDKFIVVKAEKKADGTFAYLLESEKNGMQDWVDAEDIVLYDPFDEPELIDDDISVIDPDDVVDANVLSTATAPRLSKSTRPKAHWVDKPLDFIDFKVGETIEERGSFDTYTITKINSDGSLTAREGIGPSFGDQKIFKSAKEGDEFWLSTETKDARKAAEAEYSRSLEAAKDEGIALDPTTEQITEGTSFVQGSSDPRILRQMALTLYKEDLGRVIAKESVQNSVDALPGDGRVHTHVDTRDNIVTTRDTGIGMSPQVLSVAFLNPGKSFKPGGTRGGFGVATIAMLGNSQHIYVETVSVVSGQKVRSVLEGPGTSWLARNDGANLKDAGLKLTTQIVDSDTPTGTITRYKIRPDRSLDAHESRQFADKFSSYSILPGKEVVIKVNDDTYLTEDNKATTTSIFKKSVPGADIEVFRGGGDLHLSSSIHFAVNNDGMYQLASSTFLMDSVKVPGKVIVDVKPTVDTENINYPFTPNREALRGEAEKEVQRFMERELAASLLAARKAEYIRVFNSGVDIPGTGTRILETTGSYPADKMSAIANDPDIQELTAIFKMGHDDIRDYLKKIPILKNIGKQIFYGLGISDEWFGVHVPGKWFREAAGVADAPNQNLLDPFLTMARFKRDGDYLFPGQDPIEAANKDMWHTIVHELLHEHAPNHGEGMTSALTNWMGPAMEYAAMLTNESLRLLKKTDKNGRTFADRLYDINKDFMAKKSGTDKIKDIAIKVGEEDAARLSAGRSVSEDAPLQSKFSGSSGGDSESGGERGIGSTGTSGKGEGSEPSLSSFSKGQLDRLKTNKDVQYYDAETKLENTDSNDPEYGRIKEEYEDLKRQKGLIDAERNRRKAAGEDVNVTDESDPQADPRVADAQALVQLAAIVRGQAGGRGGNVRGGGGINLPTPIGPAANASGDPVKYVSKWYRATMPMEDVLRKASPRRADAARAFRDDHTYMLSKFVGLRRKLSNPLTPREKLDVVNVLDGRAPLSTLTSREAIRAFHGMRAILDWIQNEAATYGVSTGRLNNYFPHMAKDGWWDDQPVDLNPYTGYRQPNIERHRMNRRFPHRKDLYVLDDYIVDTTRRISEAKHLGKNLEKVLFTSGGQVENTKAGKTIEKYFDIITGRDASKHGEVYDAFSKMMHLEALADLGFSSPLQLGQIVHTAAYGGVTNAIRSFADTFSKFHKLVAPDFFGYSKEEIDATISGATAPSIMHERQRESAMSRGGYLHGIPTLDKSMRVQANQVGRKVLESALASPTSLLGRYSRWEAEKDLRRLGLDPNALRRMPIERAMAEVGRVMANKTNFLTDPLSMPAWSKSPVGRLFWQFKNFAYKQAGFARDIVVLAAKGDPIPLMRILMLAPFVGEAINDIRAFLRGEGIISGIEDFDDKTVYQKFVAAARNKRIPTDAPIWRALQNTLTTGGIGWFQEYADDLTQKKLPVSSGIGPVPTTLLEGGRKLWDVGQAGREYAAGETGDLSDIEGASRKFGRFILKKQPVPGTQKLPDIFLPEEEEVNVRGPQMFREPREPRERRER